MKCDTNVSGEQLEAAFILFNQLSEKLTLSYGELESRVSQLTIELAEARSERLRQLAEKEILAARLNGLLDALPAGIVVLTVDGMICQANPLAHDMLGSQITGKPWINVAASAFNARGDELMLADGRRVSVAVTPLDAEPGKLILITDISETHALQEKLSRHQRLTSLGEMLASLAHQIRTPLASALLYLSNINHPQARQADRLRFANRASERLQHLERLLNDMLVFARGDVTAAENFTIESLIAQLRRQLEPQLKSACAILHIDNQVPGTMLNGNSDALLGAFQNLLINAIDACESDPQLEIEISQPDDKTIEFKFKDNGCGIDAAIKGRILEPFYTTRSNGTGLGLAVVNAVVAAHRGVLDIVSNDTAGSCFTISLPVVMPEELVASHIAGTSADMKQTNNKLLNKFHSNNHVCDVNEVSV